MNDNPSPDGVFHRRQRYFTDPRFQLALSLPLVATLVVLAVAYVAAIYVLPGELALKTMTAEETRRLFLRANLIYFGLAVAAILSAAIYLSHRVVGPAQVVERAVRGMAGGDRSPRLSLRPGDYLGSLASATTDLRDQLRELEEQRRQLVEEAITRLDAHDLAEVRKLLVQLGGSEAPSSPEPGAGL